jgi:hypothetical protein
MVQKSCFVDIQTLQRGFVEDDWRRRLMRKCFPSSEGGCVGGTMVGCILESLPIVAC